MPSGHLHQMLFILCLHVGVSCGSQPFSSQGYDVQSSRKLIEESWMTCVVLTYMWSGMMACIAHPGPQMVNAHVTYYKYVHDILEW